MMRLLLLFLLFLLFLFLLCDGVCGWTAPSNKFDLRLLLVDHYDSYTYNLHQLLSEECVLEPPVVKMAHDEELLLLFDKEDWDGVVLSPGPSSPVSVPNTLRFIRQHPHVPILGVCLGHQALGHVYGARVVPNHPPTHGQVDEMNVLDEKDDLWHNIPRSFAATRYHSLVVTNVPSSSLKVTAHHKGIVMALRHQEYPHYGVQFHPESIGTLPHGHTLLHNFCRICQQHKTTQRKKRRFWKPMLSWKKEEKPQPPQCKKWWVRITKVSDSALRPLQVFETLHGKEEYAVWLDSSVTGRFSILAGGTKGPHSHLIEYYSHPDGTSVLYITDRHNNNNNRTVVHNVEILDYLQQEVQTNTFVNDDNENLPFGYRGGYVGYLGYEVRHETLRKLRQPPQARATTSHPLPTAAFLFCDTSLVYDHQEQDWYIITLQNNDNNHHNDDSWTRDTQTWLRTTTPKQEQQEQQDTIRREVVRFVPNRSKEQYLEDIRYCQEMIRRGESYELCLTNRLEANVPSASFGDAFGLYKVLRRCNPAPFCSFFRLGKAALCGSSPERFVSVDRDGRVEAQPIKGTRCIHQDARTLRDSTKDRAENLMIVDLLRNDLSRVCQEVRVPKLMEVRSFATVHQMVSTICGRLRPNANAVSVLEALFPGGSMTGAPKARATEILHEVERGVPRGPYAGALGYLNANGGAADWSIVIRSAVLHRGRVTIGAGGAITALSNPHDEYDEMMLKAKAIMDAVQTWATTTTEPIATTTTTTTTTTANNNNNNNHTFYQTTHT